MPENFQPFSFLCQTWLEFGAGSAGRVGELVRDLGLRSVLVVTGTGATKDSAGFASMVSSLDGCGIEYETFPRVTPDPEAELVREATARILEGGRQAVVAYGGGSPIDCAKSAALSAANGVDILDFVYGRVTPRKPALPIIAVPTTAGTGSEMSSAAVTTDRQAKRKLGYSHQSFFPRLAVIDPETHLTLPPAVTAATGMDALTHLVESYLSLGANPASDAINLHCVRLIGANLEKAWRDGSDLEARSGMAIASALAGAAFSNTGLGMVHGFAHPVGARFGTAHGLANAILLPYVLAALVGFTPKRMDDLAEAFGLPADHDDPGTAGQTFVRALRELTAALGVPERLADLGMTESDLADILPDALSYRMRARSPRPFTDDELARLLRAAWSGDFLEAENLKP
ncbi:MAG: iron-containing alcohol dehydrogenase [Spirochaetales bacterium]|nr:MAG: iron-containing alcohol dehydrogenase [Spirochaetales bacterium]